MELGVLLHRINERLGRLLEKEGFLTRDMDHSYLAMDGVADDVMPHLQGSSISYHIAVGHQMGKKVFTLQGFPAVLESKEPNSHALVAKEGGFSLHAGLGHALKASI